MVNGSLLKRIGYWKINNFVSAIHKISIFSPNGNDIQIPKDNVIKM